MSVERKLLLIKLIGFLTGEISKTEIYEWAPVCRCVPRLRRTHQER